MAHALGVQPPSGMFSHNSTRSAPPVWASIAETAELTQHSRSICDERLGIITGCKDNEEQLNTENEEKHFYPSPYLSPQSASGKLYPFLTSKEGAGDGYGYLY
jgi:hypothetical protein